MNLVEPSPSDYLNGLNKNRLIHRYCTADELCGMLRGKLSLTCPLKWEDPFENPLFRAELIGKDGETIPLREEGQKLYCQCWTLNDESDAMWKLYGARSAGVRVTTVARDLMFRAYNAFDYQSNEAVYTKIGMMRYLGEKSTRKLFETAQNYVAQIREPNSEGIYKSLLIKRRAYRYENEVRLIANDFDGRFGDRRKSRLYLPVSDFDWIRSITFGPAVDQVTYEAHCSRLAEIGLPSDRISRSTLYGPFNYCIDLREQKV